MISVRDLLIIGFDADVPAVVKVVRDHAVAFRAHPDSYTRAERAALAEALQREAGVDEHEARRLAQRCLVQSAALRVTAR